MSEAPFGSCSTRTRSCSGGSLSGVPDPRALQAPLPAGHGICLQQEGRIECSSRPGACHEQHTVTPALSSAWCCAALGAAAVWPPAWCGCCSPHDCSLALLLAKPLPSLRLRPQQVLRASMPPIGQGSQFSNLPALQSCCSIPRLAYNSEWPPYRMRYMQAECYLLQAGSSAIVTPPAAL